MPSPGNVATPATAATVVVPERVPLPGFAPSATVTLPVKAGSVLPSASSAVTCKAGVIDAPAAVLVGWTVNISCVAVPGVMVNAQLVVPVAPVALAARVQPVPTLLSPSPGRAAPPASADTALVRARVPLPGFAPSATVTLLVKPVAVFHCPSSAVTCTAGVIAAPAMVLLGWTLKLSCVAAPAVMLNGVEVVPLRLPPLAVSV